MKSVLIVFDNGEKLTLSKQIGEYASSIDYWKKQETGGLRLTSQNCTKLNCSESEQIYTLITELELVMNRLKIDNGETWEKP